MMQDVSLAAAFGRLLVVALLMAAVLLVLRRTSKRGRPMSRKGEVRAIELIDRQSLGKTQSVAVLRVHDFTLVVGVTEQRVELLSMLDPLPAADFGAAVDADVFDLADVDRDDDEQFFERLRQRSAR